MRSGLAALPGAGAAMVGAALATPLVGRLGRGRVVALGLALAALAQLLYLRIGVSTGYATMLVAMLVGGLGATLTFAVTGDTVLATVPKERAGAAAAISETAMELGGALGMAILGTVLNGAYRNTVNVPDGVPAPAAGGVRDSLGAALDSAATLPAGVARAVAGAANQAFVHGMHVVEMTNAGILAAVALLTLATLGGLPAVFAPDGSAPDGSAPDGSAPDGGDPDGSAPDGSDPDGSEPDGGEPAEGDPAGAQSTPNSVLSGSIAK